MNKLIYTVVGIVVLVALLSWLLLTGSGSTGKVPAPTTTSTVSTTTTK